MPITSDSLRVAGIGALLYDGHLAVPVNQRSYKWEREHVSDLLFDLARAIGEGDSEYFLGSIVLTTHENGRLEIVDGQQRLATTTILIASIRDYLLATKDEKRAGNIEAKYLFETDDDTLDEEARLMMNVDDNEYFRQRILLRPDAAERVAVAGSKRSHALIEQASKLCSQHVNKIVAALPDSARAKALIQWVNYLRLSAKVIAVVVADAAGAYVIFETLNDRGLDLSKSDLLKNYLFGKAGSKRIKEAQQRWAAMLGALESYTKDDLAVTYIRHSWIATHGHVRERELYDRIREKIKTPQDAVTLAAQLADNAYYYAAILNSDHPLWNEYSEATRRKIKTLILLAIERLRPLLLAVTKCFSKKEAGLVFGMAVSWSVRFLIAGAPAGTVEQHIAATSPKVSGGAITTAKDLLDAMMPIVPKDTEFYEQFSVARVSQAFLARYYLRALEEASQDDPEAAYSEVKDEETVTLEHILPENPSPDGPWKHIAPETASSLYKFIGNMALLRGKPNADIGNGDFAKTKAPEYKNCPLKLTASIAEYKQWTEAEIKERQKALASLALKAWPLKLPKK